MPAGSSHITRDGACTDLRSTASRKHPERSRKIQQNCQPSIKLHGTKTLAAEKQRDFQNITRAQYEIWW